MNGLIPLHRPNIGEEEIEQLQEVINSGWVGRGPKVDEFEQKAAEYLGVQHAVAVSSCTAALHLSLVALGIGPGDEVLVSDFTFPATGHAVLYSGAKPVFVDIDPRTYNIDPDDMVKKVTKRTKAIIPVHMFGQPADMGAVIHLAEVRGLKVIEDAACAFGAKYNNYYAGTFGDVGCFSFHGTKGITTGEGGMVVTDDEELAHKIKRLSVFGMMPIWERQHSKELVIAEFNDLGYNYRMGDLAAAVGVAQLEKADRLITDRRKIAYFWDNVLSDLDFLEIPYVSGGVFHTYQAYTVLLDKRIDRDKLINKMRKWSIQTAIGGYASHTQPVYKSEDECPVSLDISKRTLKLPMYYSITTSHVHTIVLLLKDIAKEMI
jgi:dTDP-4-amino-4,6-dideoxygalactose transaminase